MSEIFDKTTFKLKEIASTITTSTYTYTTPALTRAATPLKTQSEWLQTLTKLASDMKAKGTLYGWKSPVNEKITMKNSTCVGYVNLALQRLGYMPSGKYIHFTNSTKMIGTGASYVKSHPELYTVIKSGKRPSAAGLKVGDIVGYKTHIMVFAGWRTTTPLWYSLERVNSKGYGKKPRIDVKGPFASYNTTVIDYIVRLKFKAEPAKQTTPAKPTTPANASGAVVKKYWITQKPLNLRSKASSGSDSKILAKIPKGAKLTAIQTIKNSNSVWIKTTYAGKTGYTCCKYKTTVNAIYK